jgi:hypothetical protein
MSLAKFDDRVRTGKGGGSPIGGQDCVLETRNCNYISKVYIHSWESVPSRR